MIAAACASGTQAVGEAFRLIQNGQVDACVAGGSSVMLTPFYLIGFAGLQAVALDNGDEPSLACRPLCYIAGPWCSPSLTSACH